MQFRSDFTVFDSAVAAMLVEVDINRRKIRARDCQRHKRKRRPESTCSRKTRSRHCFSAIALPPKKSRVKLARKILVGTTVIHFMDQFACTGLLKDARSFFCTSTHRKYKCVHLSAAYATRVCREVEKLNVQKSGVRSFRS